MPIFITHPAQRGATSLENTVIIVIFLLLAVAAYESAHWLLLRQTLNTALLDTARIAATQQAHKQIINEAFTNALQKLPAFRLQLQAPRWKIEKLNMSTLLPSETSAHVQHDYQALQYKQGNTQVFAANTLHLRLHYLHEPVTPVVRQVIRSLLSFSSGPYQNAYAQGYVPITTEVQVAMQSDHKAWTNPSTGFIFDLAQNNSSAPASEDSFESLPDDETPATDHLPIKPWQPPNSLDPPDDLPCDGNQCCGPI